MKTKLLLFALLFNALSYAQISINEGIVRNSDRKTVNDEEKLYIIDLVKLKSEETDIQKLAEFNKRITELDIKVNENKIEVNLSNLEELKKISDKVKVVPKDNPSDIETDLFYYEYFENELQKVKQDLIKLKESKKGIENDKEKLVELRKKLDEKEVERKKYSAIIKKLDSLAYQESKDKKWFPTMEEDEREIFYENLYSKDSERNNYLLSNLSAQIGTSTAAITSELIASYFKAFRVSFGTLMTNSDEPETETPAPGEEAAESDETNAFQRLLSSGGGNLYLNVEFPLYYVQSKTATLFLNSNAKAGVVLTQFSNDVDTSTGNGTAGLNLYGSLSSDDKKSFIFFFNSNFGGYGGGTDFYSKLMLKENKVFAFGQLILGLDIAKSIRVSYTVFTYGSDDSLRSNRGIIGIQLLKGLFE